MVACPLSISLIKRQDNDLLPYPSPGLKPFDSSSEDLEEIKCLQKWINVGLLSSS